MGFLDELHAAAKEDPKIKKEIKRLTKLFENMIMPTKEFLLDEARHRRNTQFICQDVQFNKGLLNVNDVFCCFKTVHGEKLYEDLPFIITYPSNGKVSVYVRW